MKRIRLRTAELRKKKEIEERRDITLQTIAGETGLSYNTVHRWMTDKPVSLDRTVMLTLANYLGVNPSELIEVVEDESDPNYKTALAYAS